MHDDVVHAALLGATPAGFALVLDSISLRTRKFSVDMQMLICRPDAPPGPPARIVP